MRRDYGRKKLMGLRTAIVRDFEKDLAFYRIERGAVVVIRILHGARDIPNVIDTLDWDTLDWDTLDWDTPD